MIKGQEDVLDICNSLHEIATEAELSQDKIDNIENIQKNAAVQQLLVPIVGQFSSGKSTLINSLMNNSILPVALTPETSLATEIRYSEGEQFAEGICEDGTSRKYDLNQIQQLTQDADQYRYAKIYVNSSILKELEPLVLVDMPGFDAPKEQHNKAIAEYLDKGLYYIVLSDINEGTISKSILRRLREIDSLNRKFSLFLSKTDLAPSSKVASVKSQCESILKDEIDSSCSVQTINNTDTQNVKESLKNINKDNLFKNLYFPSVNSLCSAVLEGINYQLKAAKHGSDEIVAAENEIRRSIEKIKTTSENDIKHMQSRYSGKMVNDIISDVSSDLEYATDEFVSAVMAKSDVEHLLNETVRSSLVQSIQQRVGEAHDSIVTDFSDSVKNLSSMFKNMEIDTNYTDKIVNTLQDAFKAVQLNMQNPADKTSNPMGAIAAGLGSAALATALKAPLSSAVAGVTGVLATTINPILGIVIAVLPSLLGGLFSMSTQKMQNNEIESQIKRKLISEVYPQIKGKLRTELPNILQHQLGQMIEQVRNQYAETLQSQQNELERALQDKASTEQETKEKTEKLENLRQNVQKIAQEIYKWKL